MSYLHEICLDEIALEGLDGITLACLWCRLNQRLPKFSLALDPKSKQFLWTGILASQDVTFYRLPEPRELPTFSPEYMTTDETTGIVCLKEEVQRKEYPACIINSAENDGIQGSCATFKDRVDISDEVKGHDGGETMTLEEVQEKWGDSLVIVASQELRFRALVGPSGDPSLELSDVRFCFLEYVGRQRHHGVQQVDFARLFKVTLTSLHSLGKDLSSSQLIDKRTCLCHISKHLKNSIFLTLLRFGPLAKHGNMTHRGMLSATLIQILEKQPKRTANMNILNAELEKKLPSFGTAEHRRKSIRKTYLLLQKLNVLKVNHRAKEVESLKLLKKLSDDKDDAAEEDANSIYDPSNSHEVAELPVPIQVYSLISRMQHTPQGVDYNDLERLLYRDGRFLRALVDTNLLKNNLVKYTMSDEGRQRIRKFQTVDMVTKPTPEKDANGKTQALASASESQVSAHKKTTDRYMKRRERVLELIRKHRVQEGCFGMLREIRQEESEEGRTTQCDRKSILRIVEQLEKEGLCETFSTVVMSDDGTDSRTVKIVLDAGVKRTDSKVLHIMQQARLRMISYKLHHPSPRTKEKKVKLKIVKSAKGKKNRSKKGRITKYETLAQSEEAETKERHPDPSSPTHDAPQEKTGHSEGSADIKKNESEDVEIVERQFAWKKNEYGLLRKMGRIRVLHRFIWYLVYGMPRLQSSEAPQPADNNHEGLGKEAVTIKQEVDDSQLSEVTGEYADTFQAPITGDRTQDSSCLIGQSTNQSGLRLSAAGQSEKLSEAGGGAQSLRDAVIGGQEQTVMSVCQSKSSVLLADQSEEPSDACSRKHNQSEALIGGLKRTTGSDITGQTTSECRLGGSASEGSDSQAEFTSAGDLLAFIETGHLPEKATKSLPTEPMPILECATPNLESEKNDFQSTNPTFDSALPNLATAVPKLEHAAPAVESVLPNLESRASNNDTNPTSTFSVGKDSRNSLPANAQVNLDVMDWRRFVKPLPNYKELPDGWCLLGDLILSMPLITFCEIIPPRYMIEGLEEYLKDPLLKLLLVKDLPDRLRSTLLESRRYATTLESIIDQLCSLGLGVYTPHLHKNKDVVSMYICRNVSILDTTSSQPGFFYISDKAYPILKYCLKTLEDVEKYWFDLKVICLDTPLGFVRSQFPKADDKVKLIKTKVTGFARKVESYMEPVVDDGRIPGDGKGAGGFDSGLYCHLKRNWTTTSLYPYHMAKQLPRNRFSKTPRDASERLSNPLKRKTVSLSNKIGIKEEVTVETKLVDIDEHKAERVGGKGLKRKRSSKPKKESETSIARKKRREEKKRAKEEWRLHQKQKRAVGIVTRKTFSWTPRENSVLLLCKVASAILNTDQSAKSSITWEAVQQVFAKKVPESFNAEGKDAKAISTRSHRLMRDPQFRMNFSVCLGEVKEDKDIIGSIRPLSDRSSVETASEEFEKLFNKLEAKFRFANGFNSVLPDDLTSLHSNYNVVPIAQTDLTNQMFFNYETEMDVKRLTLHTIVLSTLSSQNANDYDARLVFRLYEQYDTKLLHDVFLFCRTTGLVNRNRMKPQRRIVPCVPMSYQLSVGYIRHFKSKMPHELPDEAFRCQEKLLESAPEEEVAFPQVTAGVCSCQVFLLSTDQVNCRIVIPKKVIVLDSNLIDQDFLKSSGLLKKSEEFLDSDSDSDEDSEEDENDEEQSDPNEGQDTQIDWRGMEENETQGIGVIQGVRNVIRVRFDEEENDGDEKMTGENQITEDHQDLEPAMSVPREETNDRNVMDRLNELAEGLVNMESELPDTTKRRTSSAQPSATDLDHSYLGNRPALVDGNQPAVGGWGDAGETAGLQLEGAVTGSGDSSRDTSQGWTPDPRLTVTDLRKNVEAMYRIGGTSKRGTAGPSQAVLRPQPRNATMKCLSDSQTSFTKWMILQGHYAPGVCGTKISTLQENIAFNAFTIKLSLKESSPQALHQSQPEVQPCASLLEYLLRPCKEFVPFEPVRKPTELCQEASYLEELCEGKVIRQPGDNTQELQERLTGIGVDAATAAAVTQIYEKIEEAGFLGTTVPEVKRIVGRVEATGTARRPLEKYINLLIQHEMIVEVGTNNLRLVATKHASLWMIHSQRLVISTDSDSLAKRPCLDKQSDTCFKVPPKATEIVDLTGEPLVPEVQVDHPAENHSTPKAGQRVNPLLGSNQRTKVSPEDDLLTERSEGRGHQEVTAVGCPEDEAKDVLEIVETTRIRSESSDGGDATLANGSSSTDSDHGRAVKRKFAKVIEGVFESVNFIPQPWHKVNGRVNRAELFKMIRGIALQILAEPGIKESQIVLHLRNVFRKVDTLKLLQIMSDLGLITRHCVTLPKPNLFGRVKSGSQTRVFYYHPSINCLTIMGALFDSQDTQK